MWILVSTLALYSVDSDCGLSTERPSVTTKFFRCIPQVLYTNTVTGTSIRTRKFTYTQLIHLLTLQPYFSFDPLNQTIPGFSIFDKIAPVY